MADNKQNSEIKNTQSATTDKNTDSGAASTQQAKEGNSASGSTGNAQSGAASQSGNAPAKNTGAAGNTSGGATETVGAVTTQAVGQVKEKAASVIDEQKGNLASGISSVADSIRQIGENIGGKDDNNQIAALAGKYGDTLAGQVEKFSSYIEDRELKELVRDVEQFAKRNPALFVGGAFMLGILAARFLKSSGQSSGKRSRNS